VATKKKLTFCIMLRTAKSCEKRCVVSGLVVIVITVICHLPRSQWIRGFLGDISWSKLWYLTAGKLGSLITQLWLFPIVLIRVLTWWLWKMAIYGWFTSQKLYFSIVKNQPV
jgi:hypothetical protein